MALAAIAMDASAFVHFASPVILFFLLGLLASALRLDLAIPEAMAKGMSLYLMAAIGLKGGVAVAESGVNAEVAVALLAELVLSFVIPLLAYAALLQYQLYRRTRSDAAGVAPG